MRHRSPWRVCFGGDGGACPDPGLTFEGLVDEVVRVVGLGCDNLALSRLAFEGQSRIRRKPCPSNSK